MTTTHNAPHRSGSLPPRAVGLPPRNSGSLPERKTFGSTSPALPSTDETAGALPGAFGPKGLPAPKNDGALPRTTREPMLPNPVKDEATAKPGLTAPSGRSGALPRVERKTYEERPAGKSTSLPAVPSVPAPVEPVAVPAQPEPAPVEQTKSSVVESVAQTKKTSGAKKGTRVSKPKTTKKAKPGFRLNDRDIAILRLFSRYEILLPGHVAEFIRDEEQPLERAVHSITQRMRQMLTDGYLQRDDRHYPKVWRIGKAGLESIGSTETVPTVWTAVSRRPHLLKIATVGILFSRAHDPEFDIRKGVLTDAPKLFITEKMIIEASNQFDDAIRKRTWSIDVANLIADPDFPVTPAGNRISDIKDYYQDMPEDKLSEVLAQLSDWEAGQMKAIRAAWKHGREGDGYFQLADHQGQNFGKGHRPDGWICLPHIETEDGTVKGGDFAVEVEHSKKPNMKEQIRIVMQLWDHPLADGCFYFVSDTKARRMIEKAIEEIKTRNFHPVGKKPIDDYFILTDQPYLNTDVRPYGLYG